MSKPLSELKKKLSPAVVAQAKQLKDQMVLEYSLQQLRQNVAHMTQNEVAELLGVTQAHVSKLESRSDMQVSSLFGVVQAMGGTIDLIAKFNDATYKVSNFSEFQDQIGSQVLQKGEDVALRWENEGHLADIKTPL